MPRPVETWLLPEGVADVLPAEAARLEALRRRLLDLFASWGYQQVFPPLMEYLESLLTGSGHDLDLMTFKITDQLSGRMMGVRADITPQVARIDAHCLPVEGSARYCYAGTILNTRPSSMAASRCPVQIGAELYGYAGVAGDIEVIRLMLDALASAGFSQVHLDLGHVGVFRSLAQQADLPAAAEATLFEILQRKASTELAQFLSASELSAIWQKRFAALAQLSGTASAVIPQAKAALAGSGAEVDAALANIEALLAALAQSHPQLAIYVDLAELRGYHYHTGLVFAAYCGRSRAELAKGGRYDHVGEAFGRARPATGFSADLKTLLSAYCGEAVSAPIYAPAQESAALQQAVAALRAQGQQVINVLAGEVAPAGASVLQERDGKWAPTSSASQG